MGQAHVVSAWTLCHGASATSGHMQATLICTSSSTPLDKTQRNPLLFYYYYYFTGEKMEAQRG